MIKCYQSLDTARVQPGVGLLPHPVQWGSQWGLDPSPSPPIHPDGEIAGWQNSPKVEFHCSQHIAGGQVEKVCCSCLPSLVPALVCRSQTRGAHADQPNKHNMSRRINCHCLAQVCSVLRSLFLRVGAVYGISNLTNGVNHHHGEVGVVLN